MPVPRDRKRSPGSYANRAILALSVFGITSILDASPRTQTEPNPGPPPHSPLAQATPDPRTPVAPGKRKPNSPKRGGHYLEIRAGALEHDVHGLWSGMAIETGTDRNLELISPPLRFKHLPGALHFNLGASSNDSHDTSKAYAGFLWEFEFDSGFFFDLGLGGAVHNGELVYRGGRYLNLEQTLSRRALYIYYLQRASVAGLTIDHHRKELGSRNLFRVPLEFGWILHRRLRVSILFDHVSNGYLARPNEGLDTLGIRIGIRI